MGVGAQGSRCVRLAQPPAQGVCFLEVAVAIAEAAIQGALRVVTAAMVALEVMVDTADTADTAVMVVVTVVMAATEAAAMVDKEVMAATGVEVMVATGVVPEEGMAATVAVTQATGAFTKIFLSAIRIRLRHSKQQLVVRRRFRGMGVRHFPALLFLRVTQGVFLVVRDQRGSTAIANPHGLFRGSLESPQRL